MLDLFSEGEWLERENLRVYWHPQFIDAVAADKYFAQLQQHIPWQQGDIQIYGKTISEPRLSAYFGSPEARYQYSGRTVYPRPWHPLLKDIRATLGTVTPTTFNAVLCNYYRNEKDGLSWHSDDEPELGNNPEIASLSFGGSRRFQLRNKKDKREKVTFDLGHGDLLIMAGKTQAFWHHQVPKSQQAQPPRINLTFRRVHTVLGAAPK